MPSEPPDRLEPTFPTATMDDNGCAAGPQSLTEIAATVSSEEDIRGLVEFLELVLNNVYSGIIVCDSKSRIVFMNQVYAELLGTDRRAAVGHHIKDYFPSSRLGRVLSTGRAELGQRCSLQTQTPLLVNRIPLKHDGRTTGVILQTIFRDYQAMTDLLARLNLLEREVDYYKKGLDSVLSARYSFDSIIGTSPAIEEAKDLARKYARSNAPVLIMGPTGTGKELFAHAVHTASDHAAGPFVCVNCAAIPRELLESELFGYEKGAFTGANRQGKAGQIELAHRGTLYLDEVGEMPPSAQAKLLRVLESKVLDKLGGVKSVKVDFRLVAATNRDLAEMMSQGNFRDDLYYRLSTLAVRIPPLSHRTGDIPLLVEHFLSALDRPEMKLTTEAKAALEANDWPGNVRELKNVIERAVSLAEGRRMDIQHLPPEALQLGGRDSDLSGKPDTLLAQEMARHERQVMENALRLTRGNMSKACKLLGISRTTLYEKCKRHNLLPARK